MQQLITVDSNANWTALATALESLEGTAQGTALFAALPGVPKTLFAPVNEVSRRRRKFHLIPADQLIKAFARLSEDVSRNTTLLADTLS